MRSKSSSWILSNCDDTSDRCADLGQNADKSSSESPLSAEACAALSFCCSDVIGHRFFQDSSAQVSRYANKGSVEVKK